MRHNNYLQAKWRAGLFLGIDSICFGDGSVVVANCYKIDGKPYWYPLCDTTIESLEKYENDLWVHIDIFHGALSDRDETIVFGSGSMGNEGFVASTDRQGALLWGIFFTFSNPIVHAEIHGNILTCTTELDSKIVILRDNLTKIEILQ